MEQTTSGASRWVQLLAAFVGPAAVMATGIMGAGSTSALVLAGSWFRYDLLWIAIFTLPVVVVCLDSGARVGVVSGGKGMLSVIRDEIHPSVTWFVLIVMVLFNIFVNMGQMAVMTSSFMAVFGFYPPDETASEGARQLYKFCEIVLSISFAGGMLWLLLSGGYQRAQKIMTGLLFLMLICFIIVALRSFEEWRDIIAGLVPRIPNDLPVPGQDVVRSSFSSIAAIAGGAVAAAPILSFSYFTSDDKATPSDLKRYFWKAVLNLGVVFGLYSALVLVAGGYGLYPLQRPHHLEIQEVHEAGRVLARAMPGGLEFLGPRIFELGLFICGLTTLIVVAQLMCYFCLDTFRRDWHFSTENRQFRKLLIFWIVVPSILAPLWTFPPLLKMVLLMGVNIVIVPIAIIIMIYLINKRSLMGEYKASFSRNVFLIGSLGLSIWLASSQMPGYIKKMEGFLSSKQEDADHKLTYTFKETFENGSVGPWASYPPAQDTAYDPTIWVKPLFKEKNVANRALYREITPLYPIDCEFGVRRLVNLAVDRSSTLRFRAYVKAANGTRGVRIRLGFADGGDVMRMCPFNKTQEWQNCTIKFSDILKGSDVEKNLTAVAFIAVCPFADTESLHRFGLDDVEITAVRKDTLTIISPEVHTLDEWDERIATRHFEEGEKLTIRAKSPATLPSANVLISHAFTGDGRHTIPMKQSNDDWQAELTLKPGMWRAELEAVGGQTVKSSFVFLVQRKGQTRLATALKDAQGDLSVLGPKWSNYKVLFATSKDAQSNIKENAAKERNEHNWKTFNYNLDAFDETHWLETYKDYVTVLRTPGIYIRTNASAYSLLGDKEAGEAARQALLKVAAWPTFVHPHILDQGQFTYWPVGILLQDLAFGYDMVYDLLTPDERRTVADALYHKGVTEVSHEYVFHNRVSSNTSNWISHVTGGGISCAIAVRREFRDDKLEPHLTGMLLKLGRFVDAAYDKDGGYGEGHSYGTFAMESLEQIMPALERNFGIRFPDKVTERMRRALIYQVDHIKKKIYDFGDIVDTTKENIPKPDGVLPSMLFRDTGTAVFRSGFGADDFMFIFRCGPFYNHQHFDQGSFFLNDRGEEFITEMGKTDYYEDPWYQRLAIQAGGHSTILINDNPQSQQAGDLKYDVPAWHDYATITDFLLWEGGGFVSGKLDPLYNEMVTHLNRSALYVAPRTIILIDQAIGNERTKSVNLRFHVPTFDSLSLDGQVARVTRTGAALTIRSLTPENSTLEIRKRPATLSEASSGINKKGFLQVNADYKGEPLTLATILTTDNDVLKSVSTKYSPDNIALTVGGTTYMINTNVQGEMVFGDLHTDALVYGNNKDGFFLLSGRLLRQGDKGVTPLVSSDKKISMAYTKSKIYISTDGPTTVSIRTETPPSEVKSADRILAGWDYNAGQLVLKLSGGYGTLEVR